jgi:divalent metal cation (Fe/Co/Zn/Cd) transporter
MVAILEALALLSAALFAGGALYISVVEHPARMRAGIPVALAQFRQMYPLAAPWQASSAAVCLMAGVVSTLLTGHWAWAAGGVVVGAVIPFTLFALMPTNHKLLDAPAPAEDQAAVLLARWARLHLVRSLLGTAGLVVMAAAAVREAF